MGFAASTLVEDPATWTGATLTAEVRVAEVPTGRGFWIEDQGVRLYTLIVDRPGSEPVDIRTFLVVEEENVDRVGIAGF